MFAKSLATRKEQATDFVERVYDPEVYTLLALSGTNRWCESDMSEDWK